MLVWAQQAQRLFRALWPRASGTVRPTMTPAGTSWRADAGRRGGTSTAAATFNLQITDETTLVATVSTAIVGVRWGELAGLVADAGMVPENSPLFTVTLGGGGVRIIYAKIGGTLDEDTFIWTPDTCEVLEAAALPASDEDFAYVKIGQAESEVATAPNTGTRVKAGSIGQTLTGSQDFARIYYSAATPTSFVEKTFKL